MKLPRDLSGKEFCRRVQKYGYVIVRRESSHIRLTSNFRGSPHHITVPDHDELKVGTLRALLRLIAAYLQVEPGELTRELFGQ